MPVTICEHSKRGIGNDRMYLSTRESGKFII
jgi:hypothetical protein